MTENKNVSIVRTIGKGERFTEQAVESITANLPKDFDPKARGAVAELVHVWATGTTDSTQWPAVKTGPKGEQTTTDYGRGHDTLVRAVKRALKDANDSATDWLRLVRQAAENAHNKGNLDADTIIAAAMEALTSTTEA